MRFSRSALLVVLFSIAENIDFQNVILIQGGKRSSSLCVNGFVATPHPSRVRSFKPMTSDTEAEHVSQIMQLASITSSEEHTSKSNMKQNTERPSQQGRSQQVTKNSSDNVRPPNQQQRRKSTQQQRRQPMPWRADRHTSMRTQKRIQDASRNNNYSTTPIKKAVDVLSTLLSTPPEQCNQANVNCALTLSAKILSSFGSGGGRGVNSSTRQDREKLRSLLMKTFDVLHILVKNKRLNERQLCNAIWAIGKHYNRDKSILPTYTQEQRSSTTTTTTTTTTTSTAMKFNADKKNNNRNNNSNSSSKSRFSVGTSELWMFDKENDIKKKSSERKLDITIDLIAEQLTSILDTTYGRSDNNNDNSPMNDVRQQRSNYNNNNRSKNNNNNIKVGEIAMATWSYGILKPRRLPPGWIQPRQIGKLQTTPPITSRQVQLMQRQQIDERRATGVEFVTLDEWNNEDDNNNIYDYEESTNVIDKLFDSIGMALTYGSDDDDENEEDDHSHEWIDDVNDKMETVANNKSAYTKVSSTETTLIQEASWKELSNIAWSYATHGHCRTKPSEKVMMLLAREAIRRLNNRSNNDDNGDDSSKAHIVATVDNKGNVLKKNNQFNSDRFLTRDVAQLVWSLGTLHSDNYRLGDDLVHLIDAVAKYWLKSYNDDNIDQNNETSQDERPLQFWSCADLVQVVVSMSHGRVDHLPLLRAIYEEAYHRLDEEGSIDNNGNVRRALLTGRGRGANSGGDDKRKQFFTWEISVLLWSQARMSLGLDQGEIFDKFVSLAPVQLMETLSSYENYNKQNNNNNNNRNNNKRGQQQRGRQSKTTLESIGIGPQEQANIAWSLTALEKYDTTAESMQLLRKIFQESYETIQQSHTIQLEHAHQLWQSLFLLEDECPICVDHVPDWFYNFLKDKWLLEKSRRKISSARHKAISQTLNFMGVSHYNEHDEDIDVAIVLKENDAAWTGSSATHERDHNTAPLKVAVEFDGPNHFTREDSYPPPPQLPQKQKEQHSDSSIDEDDNEQRGSQTSTPVRSSRSNGGRKERPRALGHTVLKYRLLKKLGWTVVRVPYYEFDKIPFWASMERQRYLQRLLKTHAELSFSTVDVSEYKAPVADRQSRFD